MIDIKTDDLTTRTIEHFGALSAESRARLVRAMGGLTSGLLSQAQAAAPRKTGRLAQSLRRSVREFEHRVIGKVWSDSNHAGVIEFGKHGSETVNGFTRRQTEVFGKMVAPVAVAVAGFTRNQNIAAHPFLRRALADMDSQIADTLQSAYDGLDQ